MHARRHRVEPQAARPARGAQADSAAAAAAGAHQDGVQLDLCQVRSPLCYTNPKQSGNPPKGFGGFDGRHGYPQVKAGRASQRSPRNGAASRARIELNLIRPAHCMVPNSAGLTTPGPVLGVVRPTVTLR
eukprot:7425369-Pyramimonas_sp.AAC.1